MLMISSQLAEFAASLRLEDVPSVVVDAMECCTLDSVGCAVGGASSRSAQIALRLAPHVSSGRQGRLVGDADGFSTPEAAGFANSVMIRELDFNDWYPGGHPSDCLGPLLAIAESVNADGRQLLTSGIVAYEIFVRLCKSAPLKERGWDQGFSVAVATAAAAAHLLGLNQVQAEHAISIAAVAHAPLRVTKAGELSLWKGAAAPHAARNGLQSALMAAEGMTGPDAPFEGRDGVWDLLSGEFVVQPFGAAAEDFVTTEVGIKYWPVCGGLQAPVEAACLLREEVSLEDVTELTVQTYRLAWSLNGSDTAKWDPQTRGTADHSIPYAVVLAMLDGQIGEDSFAPARIADPVLRPLMSRVKVVVDDAIDRLYPDEISARLVARMRGGDTVEVVVTNPKGHRLNPLSTVDVAEKFSRLARSAGLTMEETDRALEAWNGVRGATELSGLFSRIELGALRSLS